VFYITGKPAIAKKKITVDFSMILGRGWNGIKCEVQGERCE
jgi:hypothetical protein